MPANEIRFKVVLSKRQQISCPCREMCHRDTSIKDNREL